MARLIKIDKNGTKYWEGRITCDRCQGRGWYAIGVNNGQLVPSHIDQAVCWKCGGAGTVIGKWKEYTPEHEAKLEKARQRRRAKQEAEAEKVRVQVEAERAEREAREEAERKAEEERIKAEKAVSQYIGEIGEKVDLEVEIDHTAWYERQSFSGYGTETVYIHTFKDDAGNKIVWKTTSTTLGFINPKGDWIPYEAGDRIHLKGTVKEHSEYKDEKQTVLTRCRIS